MKSTFGRDMRWIWILLTTMLVAGCSPDEPRYAILTVVPNPVHQGNVLRIEGTGFGTPVPGTSGVAIGTSCAPVLFWDDTSIAIQVPGGIGVGVKQLRLARGDGSIRTTDLVIGGEDLSPDAVTTDCGAVFSTLPPPDVADPPDATDMEITDPPDVIPDVVPDITPDLPTDGSVDTDPDQSFCLLSTGQGGECTGDADCALQREQPGLLWESTGDCVFGCVADPESLRRCVADCQSINTGISEACGFCYGFLGECALNNCVAECTSGVMSPECISCVESAGCPEVFSQCSGTRLVLP